MARSTKPVRRSLYASPERRVAALSDGAVAGRNFTGKAAVFNQRTAIGDPFRWGFYETIAPGAFDKTLREMDQVFLADHDPGKPLARRTTGTLRLAADTDALNVDADLVGTSYADDLIANIAFGNVRGMSFEFIAVKDDWQDETVATVDGQEATVEVRTVQEVKCPEVSTTAFPAYTGTTADVRSLVRAALDSRATRSGRPPAMPSAIHLALLGVELRVGATLSADTLKTLQQVLDYLATADDAVDAAQPVLATLMGVPNPDADDPDSADDTADDDAGERSNRPTVSLLSQLQRRQTLIGLQYRLTPAETV